MSYTAEEAAYNKDYYERTKQLKGREKGSSETTGVAKAGSKTPPPADRQAARAAAAKRVSALNAKLTQLRAALAAAKKKSPSKTPKPGSAEAESKKKADNEKYYQENKSKIAAKAVAKGKGGSSASKKESSPTSSGTRSVAELETAIKATLGELKTAIAKLKTL